MIGNCYFESNSSLATYPNHGRIRQIVESTGTEVIWISGHVHCNSITMIRGVRHITLQALTETSVTYPHPAGAIADLVIDDRAIDLVVRGRDPFEVRVQRQKCPSWVEPLPALQPAGIVKLSTDVQ